MRALSQDLLYYGYWGRQMVTVTIVPQLDDPEDTTTPTVTLTATGYTQVDNSIQVPIGTPLTIKVSCLPNYLDWGPETYTVTGPLTKTITLSSQSVGTLDITPVPSDSIVNLRCPGCIQVSNSITVPIGYTVHCSVLPNNNANLERYDTDITVNKAQEIATLYCQASVTISPTPENAITTIKYGGRTYPGSEPLLVPYNSKIRYSATCEGYDDYPETEATITQSGAIAITLNRTMIRKTVVPKIKGTETPHATVTLMCEGVETVSGLGTQYIDVPSGSVVSYIVSQQYYDTMTGECPDPFVSGDAVSVELHAATLGVLLFDSDTTWTVPTTDDMKMAIITNGGNGGSVSSAKQIGGTGGGASGNTYVVDVTDWEAGDVIGFSFTGSAVVITKNQVDYGDPYPNGGSGTNSSAVSLTFDGTNGGSASYGNGGGGGSGGAKYTVYTYKGQVCSGPSCHEVIKSIVNRGSVANGGAGGINSACGVNGDGSMELNSIPSAGGIGGTGFDNTAFGGAQNGATSTAAEVSDTVAGEKGLKGLGAINSQNTILTLIQQGALTSVALRNLIQGGGGGTGGVYTIRSGLSSSTKVATPGTGGGGGAWTDGEDGVDGTYGLNETDTVLQSGGAGGHGCVIIWRPSDVVFNWGQGQLGE